MNRGTKFRTIFGILVTLNTVLAVTDITQFGNEKLTLAYKVISVIVNAIVVGINTYYNNDYSEEACIGTGITRQLKKEKEEGYIGDTFYTAEGEPMGMDLIEDDNSPIELSEEEPMSESNEEAGEIDE